MNNKTLSNDYNYLAPDGSEIRLLVEGTRGGLCHCTLQKGKISKAVRHRTVEEIWYFLEGEGEIWLKNKSEDKVFRVNQGVSISIPCGTHFQFRNIGNSDLKFIISTMPPWEQDKDEAVPVDGKWKL